MDRKKCVIGDNAMNE